MFAFINKGKKIGMAKAIPIDISGSLCYTINTKRKGDTKLWYKILYHYYLELR